MKSRYIDMKEAAAYIGLSRSRLYFLVEARQVPCYRPNGRRIMFAVDELDEWMQASRQATARELAAEAQRKGGTTWRR